MHTVSEIGQEDPLTAEKSAPMEFDLLDLLLVLASGKRFIFLTSLAGFVLVAVICTLRGPIFTATAVIMPPQQEQSSAATLLGQFGSLASMAGLSSSLGLKNSNDLYIGIFKSETIADGLIKKFDLMRLYHAKKLSQARAALAGQSKFVSDKDGLIKISVEDRDPHRAADLANAYVEELYKLNSHLAITQASQRRLFFEQQLAQEKDRLADAEVALKQTEESTGVIAPTGQTETVIRQIATLQAEITSREVTLDSLRTSSTEQNPDVIRLGTEVDGLRSQLQNLEDGQEKQKRKPGDISITTASVPGVGLEYIRKERDVKYHQLLFDLLARQYEVARIDEAKAAPVIQVVDPALVPDSKSGPHRLLWSLVGGVVAFFFGCVWVLVAHAYRRLEKHETVGRRLDTLKQEFRLRG